MNWLNDTYKERAKGREQANAEMRREKPSYDRQVLVNVLVYHVRTETSGCVCGGVALGESFAEHVADVYEKYVLEGGGE